MFVEEISRMMYGFGDSPRPLPETAAVIEEIVKRQMSQVLIQASEVSQTRNGRNSNKIVIRMEDIIFLMRKSPIKIQRLMKYLGVRDAIAVTTNDEENLRSAILPAPKRTERVREFLSKIDTDNRLLSALENKLVDQVRLQRLKRLDLMSRDLDERKYAEFTKARQASFRGPKFPKEFYDWITGELVESDQIKIDKFGLELLSYLAYETVGHIVDTALLIRNERIPSSEFDPVARQMTPLPVNPHFPMVQAPKAAATATAAAAAKVTEKPEEEQLVNKNPLEPWEIREIIRRLHHRVGPLSWYNRGVRRSKQYPLIAI